MSNVTICLHCGGDVRLDPRTGIPTCLNCRREYKDTLEDTSYELQEIVKARQQREFLKAEELCEELKKMQPESSEVYWQTLLAELGVVYVKEGNVSKPTFFSFSYHSLSQMFPPDDSFTAMSPPSPSPPNLHTSQTFLYTPPPYHRFLGDPHPY